MLVERGDNVRPLFGAHVLCCLNHVGFELIKALHMDVDFGFSSKGRLRTDAQSGSLLNHVARELLGCSGWLFQFLYHFKLHVLEMVAGQPVLKGFNLSLTLLVLLEDLPLLGRDLQMASVGVPWSILCESILLTNQTFLESAELGLTVKIIVWQVA